MRPLLSCAAIALGIAQSTPGAWPDDANAPIVVGTTATFTDSLDLALTTTPDGATWVAWVDDYCLGDLRIQRIAPDGSVLAPGGMLVEHDNGCGVTVPPMLAACADGSVVVRRALGGPTDVPMHRVGPDGSLPWGNTGVMIDPKEGIGQIGQIVGLPDGGVLVAWTAGFDTKLHRFNADGSPAWDQAASMFSNYTSNRRVVALVVDDNDDAIVFWDSPLTYKRMIFAIKFTSDGAPAWAEATVVVPASVGSSLHTRPAAVADGSGGALLVWTDDHEIVDLPMPMNFQRINADGSLAFDEAGVRLSLDTTRQFDPVLLRDKATNDALIAWRDGPAATPSLRAQRMSAAGHRLWGDAGVGVSPLSPGSGARFAGAWTGETLLLPVSDDPAPPLDASIVVHALDANGALGAPMAVYGASPAGALRAGVLPDDALALAWAAQLGEPTDALLAHRLSPDGTLGGPIANPDLNDDGAVDSLDLNILLASFGCALSQCAGDTDADGDTDSVDLNTLLGAFGG